MDLAVLAGAGVAFVVAAAATGVDYSPGVLIIAVARCTACALVLFAHNVLTFTDTHRASAYMLGIMYSNSMEIWGNRYHSEPTPFCQCA